MKKRMKRPYATMVLMTALAGASAAVAMLLIEASLLGGRAPHGLWLAMIVSWLGVLAVVGASLMSMAWVLLARRRAGRPRAGSIALEILQRRLAAGAITREEYEQKRRALARHAL